jgi:hypothetical protein
VKETVCKTDDAGFESQNGLRRMLLSLLKSIVRSSPSILVLSFFAALGADAGDGSRVAKVDG